jgi:gliding motility-associated-like protein
MKNQLKKVLLFILSTIVFTTYAQNQNNQWYFGNNNALNFNSFPPSTITGSQCYTREGSASIADRTSGALLFYTDGITVWNANNAIMPNGTGLLGWSDTPSASSTSAAVIVPKPNSNTIFYIITASGDSLPSGTNGIYYSIVDMTLNGGLGDIVSGQKNILLYTSETEKLHVVPSNTGCYWLVTTAFFTSSTINKFASFNISQNGINPIAVESNFPSNAFDQVGHIKINRQFNKLAIGESSGTKISLFDFNNTTGVISNPKTWSYNFQIAGSIYGLEFSPNGNRLYTSTIQREVVQYNISLPTVNAIEASGIDVYNGSTFFHDAGAIQLGKNDKIYIRAQNAIDIINNPDALGNACNYQESFINLPSNLFGLYGLPQWIYYPTTTNTIVSSGTCVINPVDFSLQNTTNVIGVNWNFGDASSGTNNIINTTTSPFSVQHTFSGTGTFTVTAIVDYGCFTLPLTKTVTIVAGSTSIFAALISRTTCQTGASIQPLIPTTSDNGISGTWNPDTIDNSVLGATTYTFTPSAGQCASNTSFTITVNSNITPTFSFATTICAGVTPPTLPATSDNGITGTWSPATITTTGNYVFTPNNAAQCGTSKTVVVTVTSSITPTFSFATTICTGATAPTLPATSDNGITGTWNPTTITTTGNYVFTPNNAAQCGTTKTVVVTVTSSITPTFSFATTICTGATPPTLPTTSDNGITGTWSPATITTSGNYVFTPNNAAQCGSNKTVAVTVTTGNTSISATYEISSYFDDNQYITINVLPNGNYSYQLDNGAFQNSNQFENLSDGNHAVKIIDQSGCNASLNINFFTINYPKFFTPNNDGFNDYWNIKDPKKILKSNVEIYDRFGKLIKQIKSSELGWDGTYNGNELPATDYWFVITYTENGIEKQFKSHFSLKR